MFKLHRHRSDRLGDKIEFKLSSLQAIKVPRGWDRLSLSIISEQSGKVIAKTGKVTVRSGNCQWTETQSIWVSQDDTTKELEECQFKIVVSQASSRSAILGEVILNLAECLSKETSGPHFFPLMKCDFGTTLQVKIQCSTLRSNFSFSSSSASKFGNETHSHHEYQNIDDTYSRSDGSDHRFDRSIHLGSSYHPSESDNRDTYFSASSSHRSSNSGDSFGRTTSPKNSLAAGHVGRQDSSGSHISTANGADPGDEPLRSNPSSFNSRASGSSVHNQWQDKTAQTWRKPVIKGSDSSKEFDEAAEEIDELHDEIKMWERHSRQLKHDLQILKKEISEKSKNQENLESQLSAAYSECESLKLEIEKLKTAQEASASETSHISSVKNGNRVFFQKELEDELKFQKDSNAYLTQQLTRTQESNIELVSILQELEEMIEKQKLEIANLSQKDHADEDEGRIKKLLDNQIEWERKLALKEEEIVRLEEKLSSILNNDQQNHMPSDGIHSDLLNEIKMLKNKVNELERDCNELTDENLDLIFKLKKLSKDNEEGNYEFGCNLRPFIDAETSGQLKDKIFTAQETEKAEKKRNTNDFIEDELPSMLLLREKEIDELHHSNNELEDLLYNLQKEKIQLEQELASLHREYIDTSKHLQDAEHNLLVLTGNMELQVSVNKTLERKSTDLESCKNELELHVSELEQENVNLSKCISGLEAQIRNITNEKESNRLELEDIRSLATELKHEVEHQRAEMETQKAELKQKLQESQKRLSEVQEESDIASRSNSKLQVAIDSLTEECCSLQKLNGDLKRQKLELHQYVAHVEVELDESKKKIFDFYKQVELLEGKLSSMEKEIASKEKSLLSQLEHIFQDHKEQEERIAKANILSNKIELEKIIEIENLKKEIAELTLQMSSDHDDREKIVSDALREASLLRTERAKLECNLQEVNSKVKLNEVDLENQQRESKNKIQGLVDLLNASKQNEEMLMTEIKHMQQTIDSVKSSEEKYRKMASNMGLKHKDSEHEKQQVMEEISALKSQLQKMSNLQDSVFDLESSLDKANFEKRKSAELFKSLSEEYQELKSEKEALMEKYSAMQKTVSNAEDDRRSRISLQEKVLRLEDDLSAKEGSYAQVAELKNELNQIKRTNSEYQRKVQSLEQENEELMKKVQIMEKAVMLRKTSHQDEKVSSEDADHEDVQMNQISDVQLKRDISEKQADHPEVPKKAGNDNTDKILSLESELKEMKERFLNMSLQYAEVEAQREELVMQLKSVKKDKRWF